jgi:hypothetical protein
MDGFSDHYRTLQVDPAAEPEVIEAAYRALARKHHPDRNPSPTAAAEMARLNQAFEVLRNPTSRRAFDGERGRAISRAVAVVPRTEPEVRRPQVTLPDTGRGISLFIIFPLFLLAGAGLAALILFGPLGDSDIQRTEADDQSPVATTTPRVVAPTTRAGVPRTATPTPQPSMLALRNAILRAENHVLADERTADVTGDGIPELLVLARAATCGDACTRRTLFVISRNNDSWPVRDLDNASIEVSLSQPGFDVTQPLRLSGEESPTTNRVTSYRWTGSGFSTTGVYFDAIGTADLEPSEVVRRFYQAIGRKGLLPSYGLLSRGYQERHPFETWAAGYATTTAVRVESVESQGPGMVAVSVVATDAGKERRFTGTWRLVETPSGWRLDEGAIEER